MIATEDIHWVAGFLEGEGSFTRSRNGGMRITTAQANESWQPIMRLHRLFGGSLYRRPPNKQWAKATEQLHWHLSGRPAVGLMMTLYSLLSPRRQHQIKTTLEAWKKTHPNGYKTHCPHGHAYEGSNLVWYRRPTGMGRFCRTCQRRCGSAAQRRYRKKLRVSAQ